MSADAGKQPQSLDLVVVDEADRLKTAGLEQLRNLYDRRQIGLFLIGVPGLRPLSGREFQHVVDRRWAQLGLNAVSEQAIEADVVNAIARVTRGNFRLIERLFAQIERVLAINNLHVVTTAVVDAARESLVVGAL